MNENNDMTREQKIRGTWDNHIKRYNIASKIDQYLDVFLPDKQTAS